MTCDDCIHKSVCYRRIESVSPSYADKCGDFESDNNIEPFKPMVEIDLYSVIKQKYIEREVLDNIKGYIGHIRNTGMGKKKSLDFIEKFIDGLKAESEG